MARSRMIRPEFFDDEKLSECSVSARLLFISMWVNSDDYGVVKGSPRWLKAQAFPYDEIPISVVEADLTSLQRIQCIIPYTHNGETYFYIRNWDKYQTVNRPSKLRNPKPPADISSRLTEHSVSTHAPLTDETETETETEKNPLSGKPDRVDEKVPFFEIIADLNRQSGKNFRASTRATREMIRARWKEGATFEDFEYIHRVKCAQWAGTDQDKFLRPETLYRPHHFESYRNERMPTSQEPPRETRTLKDLLS